MISWLKNKLGIHSHQWIKIGYEMKEDRWEYYTVREYKCNGCGKIKFVDGRLDRLQ